MRVPAGVGSKDALCFDGLLPMMQPLCEELGIALLMTTGYRELTPQSPMLPLPELFQTPKADLPEGIIDRLPALAN